MATLSEFDRVNINREALNCEKMNDLDTLKEIYALGADNLNEIAVHAAECGHFPVVQWAFNEEGCTHYRKCYRAACAEGHLDIVQFLVELEEGDLDLGAGMERASQFGHRPVIEYLRGQGAPNVETCLQMACRVGNMSLARYFIAEGATNFNEGLRVASEASKFRLAKLMVDSGASEDNVKLYAKLAPDRDIKAHLRSEGQRLENERVAAAAANANAGGGN